MKGKGGLRLAILIGLSILMAMLAGCAGGFGEIESMPVSSSMVQTTMQFVRGPELGPIYDVSMDVPEDWVGQFEVRNIGNRLYFDYVGAEGQPAQIFFIDALSPKQYWSQSGGFPGTYSNIVNKGDTFFIYYLPIDSYYSDLPQEQFLTFAESVPQIVESFMAEAQ